MFSRHLQDVHDVSILGAIVSVKVSLTEVSALVFNSMLWETTNLLWIDHFPSSSYRCQQNESEESANYFQSFLLGSASGKLNYSFIEN